MEIEINSESRFTVFASQVGIVINFASQAVNNAFL